MNKKYFLVNSLLLLILGSPLQATSSRNIHSTSRYKLPPGSKVYQNEDGSSVQINADGSKIIKNADGSSIEVRSDKSKIIHDTDGTVIEMRADGSKTIKKSDGSVIEVKSKWHK